MSLQNSLKKTGRKCLPTSSNPKNIFENLNPTLKKHQGTMQVHEVLDCCVFMEIVADWNPGMWGWYKNYGYLQKQVVDVQLDVDTFGKLVSLCFIWITWVHGTYICGSMGETNVSWKQHLLSSKFMCGKSMILLKKNHLHLMDFSDHPVKMQGKDLQSAGIRDHLQEIESPKKNS